MSLRSRFPRGEHVPPPRSTPLFEMEQIRRTENDLNPSQRRRPHQNVWARLIAVVVVIVVALILAGWFLIGLPSAHGPGG